MALVACDGFDHYATNGGLTPAPTDILARRGGGIQWNSQAAVGYVTPGRNSFGGAIELAQDGYLRGTLTAPISAGFVGFAALTRLVTNDNHPYFQLVDLHAGNVVQISVQFNVTTNSIQVYRGDLSSLSTATLLGATLNNVFSNGTWNYIEISATIHPTAGAVTVRLNGTNVLVLTGQNTQNSANAVFDGVWFQGAPRVTSTYWQIDDFYVADTTAGSGLVPFNAFIGDARVWTLWTTGDATTQQWTPLTGTNWQQVVETNNDGDASYNSTLTIGARDNFHFQTLPASVQVLAVQVTGSYRRDAAGPRTVNQHLTSGGTDVTGTNYVLPNTYVYCCDFWTVDPHTGAGWTVAAANAVSAGYGLVA
jgi:hypothetical protein